MTLPRRATIPCMLLMACMLAACAGGNSGARTAAGDQVRVRVSSVGYDQESGTHYVVLEDHASGRTLPIMIGEEEARAIMLEMHGIKPERPLTYELLQNVIATTGNRVDRIVIADVREQVYYAKIYLDGGRYAIDSRPSDAIALAVGVKAPIFVADHLFSAGGQAQASASATVKTASGLGLTVQELTPELARYFAVQPQSGVVVADIDANATKAGLRRGDIVTEVGRHQVRTTPEFYAAASMISRAPYVTLTVRRGKNVRVITLGAAAASATGTH
ncbi:MAG: bifunctional nuclease domain-containing protein [Candidatus Binataceae bacterium]